MWARLLRWWLDNFSVLVHFEIIKGKTFPDKCTRERVKEPTEIVIHESCTRSRKRCFAWLKRKGYSVEYTVALEHLLRQARDRR
jgi:hypothetical protein